MAPGRVEDFFEEWTKEGFPEEGENCLPDFRLVELAKTDNRAAWPTHVKDCKHCSEVIHLLQSTEQGSGKIYEILNSMQAKERRTERGRRPSVLSQAWSFFSFGQPRWAVPALAVSLILLFVGWGISDRWISPNENGTVVATLGEDRYGNTAQLLKATVDKLNDPDTPLQEKRSHLVSLNNNIPEINKNLAVLTKESLPPDKRAELANLVAAYNSGVTVVQHDLASQRNSPATQTPKIASTADSELVAKIYTTAYSSAAKKNAVDENKPRTEEETAIAVQGGKKEVNVIAIEGNEVQVFDLNPDRNPQDTDSLKQSLLKTLSNSGNQQPVSVRWIPVNAFTKAQ